MELDAVRVPLIASVIEMRACRRFLQGLDATLGARTNPGT
jgi:hypothetical protein